MAWLILVLSGIFEAVWATALGKSAGLSKITPSIIFIIALLISMAGLAYSLKTLPTGTAYAVWVCVGASLAVVYGMITGAENVSVLKIVCIMIIIAGIVGLKLLHK